MEFIPVMFLFVVVLVISTITQSLQINKLKKRAEKAETQSEKDNARLEQLDKTVSQLQMRIDIMSQPRRD